MAASPLLEEVSGGPAGNMLSELAGYGRTRVGQSHVESLENNRPPRRLTIYPASAGFDLVEELDYLCARTIEPNVWQSAAGRSRIARHCSALVSAVGFSNG